MNQTTNCCYRKRHALTLLLWYDTLDLEVQLMYMLVTTPTRLQEIRPSVWFFFLVFNATYCICARMYVYDRLCIAFYVKNVAVCVKYGWCERVKYSSRKAYLVRQASCCPCVFILNIGI